MKSRNKRFHIELPKVYKDKLDALFIKTEKKDLDRAYYAVLLMHYLENPASFQLSEGLTRIVVKKLKETKNLTSLSLSLHDYDYYKIMDYSEINFRSLYSQTILCFCSMALNFLQREVKSLSVSAKFQLIINL